jgi:hypothetical protein
MGLDGRWKRLIIIRFRFHRPDRVGGVGPFHCAPKDFIQDVLGAFIRLVEPQFG